MASPKKPRLRTPALDGLLIPFTSSLIIFFSCLSSSRTGPLAIAQTHQLCSCFTSFFVHGTLLLQVSSELIFWPFPRLSFKSLQHWDRLWSPYLNLQSPPPTTSLPHYSYLAIFLWYRCFSKILNLLIYYRFSVSPIRKQAPRAQECLSVCLLWDLRPCIAYRGHSIPLVTSTSDLPFSNMKFSFSFPSNSWFYQRVKPI